VEYVNSGAVYTFTTHLHDELMRARHQRQAVIVIKLRENTINQSVIIIIVVVVVFHHTSDSTYLFRYILAKRVAGAARRDAPAAAVIRVGPQQVAHRAFVRHLCDDTR